jgi:mitogen-activated protein kinase kinase kinase
MYNIAQGNPPQLPTPDQLSPQGIDFLKRCFVRDSKKRDTAVELLEHEWIMAIRNQIVGPTTPSSEASGSTAPTQNTPSTAASSMKGQPVTVGDGFTN